MPPDPNAPAEARAASRAIITEKRTVEAMVRIYCASHHPSGPPGRRPPRPSLCDSCADLLAYSHARLDGCPYGTEKPACKQCPVHCYKPDRREAMRELMRFAGPRMIWRHPWLALVHMWKDRRRREVPRPPSRAACRR